MSNYEKNYQSLIIYCVVSCILFWCGFLILGYIAGYIFAPDKAISFYELIATSLVWVVLAAMCPLAANVGANVATMLEREAFTQELKTIVSRSVAISMSISTIFLAIIIHANKILA